MGSSVSVHVHVHVHVHVYVYVYVYISSGLEAVHVAKVFRTLDINLNGAIGVAEILCLKVHGTWTWTWHMHGT